MKTPVCLLVALLLGESSYVTAETLYNVTDLGRLEIPGFYQTDYSVQASGINNAGQVAGTYVAYNVADFHYYGFPFAFLSSNGQMTALTPPLLGSAYYSLGTSVNNMGQVTGAVNVSAGGYGGHALLYNNGQIQDLGTLGGNASKGNSINDAGQVTGTSVIATGDYHAFLYSNGQMTDLGTLGGSNSQGNSINSTGQVVGFAENSAGSRRAFLYSNGQMTDLGTLGGSTSSGNSINGAGQITGAADLANGGQHAFLYSNGQMTDLGTLGVGNSNGLGINNAGQVVGSSDGHAFLYSNGQMQDLNNLVDPVLRLNLQTATAINDNGQIVTTQFLGYAPYVPIYRSYLLTPVPEPSTLALFGLALLALGLGARRYRNAGC